MLTKNNISQQVLEVYRIFSVAVQKQFQNPLILYTKLIYLLLAVMAATLSASGRGWLCSASSSSASRLEYTCSRLTHLPVIGGHYGHPLS